MINFLRKLWYNPSRRWSKKNWNFAYINALCYPHNPEKLKYLTKLKEECCK